MELDRALRELEAAGTEQNRKVYRAHGAKDPMFGVSFKKLDELKKAIVVDHALAEALWATGNTDARMLAAKIADPARATPASIQAWASEVDYYCLADVLSGFVATTAHAAVLAERWTRSGEDFIAQMGYNLVAHRALAGGPDPDAVFEPWIETIRGGIGRAKNRTRHAMNNALIAIGIRNDRLEALAVAAARSIGKVQVDHGATGCKTPDAVEYIAKARAHRRAQEAKRAAAPGKPARRPQKPKA